MQRPRLPIVDREFLIGYARQREWAWLIAAAFFLGKVGAGLFFVSFFTDFPLGALVGVLIVGLGKSTAHLLFLGRPERFWRAAAHWRTSRISQGLLAMGAFLAFGAVYLALELPAGTRDGAAQDAVGALALAGALLVMVYDGFVLKASRGVALWDSWLLPVLALLYALLGGTTLTLVLRAIESSATSETELHWLQLSLLGLNLALVSVYLLTAQVRSAAAELAVRLLTRGPLGLAFLLGAIGVGLVATIALGAVFAATDSQGVLAAAAVTDLLGHFLVFFTILRAGIYAPLRQVPFAGLPARA